MNRLQLTPFSVVKLLQLMERRIRKKSHVAAAAATIIGLGERQKTMVEKRRKVCVEIGFGILGFHYAMLHLI